MRLEFSSMTGPSSQMIRSRSSRSSSMSPKPVMPPPDPRELGT